MITLLINILILALVMGLAVWVIRVIGLPDPFGKIALAVLGLIAIIYLLGMLGVVDMNVPRVKLN